jgi:hypothetical protein
VDGFAWHTIAFFAVQWDTEITVKWLVVALASFLVTLVLVESIKRIRGGGEGQGAGQTVQ